jgi:hypothetical protein
VNAKKRHERIAFYLSSLAGGSAGSWLDSSVLQNDRYSYERLGGSLQDTEEHMRRKERVIKYATNAVFTTWRPPSWVLARIE